MLRSAKHASLGSCIGALLVVTSFVFNCFNAVNSFPMVYKVQKKSVKCVNFDYPKGDNLDFIFIAMPYDVKPDYIDYYVRLFGVFKPYGDLRLLDDLPNHHVQFMREFARYGEDNAVRVSINKRIGKSNRKQSIFNSAIKYHEPILKSNMVESTGEICISNMSKDFVKFLFEVIPFDPNAVFDDEDEEDGGDEESYERRYEQLIKQEHLEPLEKEVKKIADTGKRIIKNFRLLEGKEMRMRKTSNGTNKRVRHFFNVTIFILLLTSFIQNRYLKSFFRKKKMI